MALNLFMGKRELWQCERSSNTETMTEPRSKLGNEKTSESLRMKKSLKKSKEITVNQTET